MRNTLENACRSKRESTSLINQKGITLIALVVTIIVLLILAGVTIRMTLSDQSLFKRARNSTDSYNQAQHEEQQSLTGYTDYYDSMKDKYGNGDSGGGSGSGGSGSGGITPTTYTQYTLGQEVTCRRRAILCNRRK